MRMNRILSLLTALSAFYLLIAGAQVNAWQAAGAVPTWPLSYGRILAPEWPGNVFYEQHHRATAGTTLLLFAVLWIALALREAPAAARRMSHLAGGALTLQVLMGGLIVLRLNPPWLGAVHSVVAIATVVLIAATALTLWRRPAPAASSPEIGRIRDRAKIGLAALALLIAFGAVTRHPPVGDLTYITTLMAHLFIAVLAAIFLALLAASMIRAAEPQGLRPWGWILLAGVVGQVGFGARVLVVSPNPLDQPWPPPAGFPAAHAAHVVLAAVIATCLVATLLYRPTKAPPARS